MVVKSEPKSETAQPHFSPLNEQWEAWTHDLQTLPPRSAFVKLLSTPCGANTNVDHSPASVYPEHQLSGILQTYRTRYQRNPAQAKEGDSANS